MSWDDHPELVHAPGDGYSDYDDEDDAYDEDSNTVSYFDDNEAHFTGLQQMDRMFRNRSPISHHQSGTSVDYNANFRPHKENGMLNDVTAQDLEDEARTLMLQAAKLRGEAKRQRKRAKVFGKDKPVGTVLLFQKTYETNEAPFRSVRNMQQPVHYTYAAVRTPIGWTLTTTRHYAMDPKTWEELIEFIGDSHCQIATVWEEIQ